MQFAEIYARYWIPPNLQRHMSRVAAVAMTILDEWTCDTVPNRKYILHTLMLHDIAKIVDFTLSSKDKLLDEERRNVEYWKAIQKKFMLNYGVNEHQAMLRIVKEIGVADDVVTLLDEFGNTSASHKVECQSWDLKICTYSDFRVAPAGVVSVDERFDELKNRRQKANGTETDMKKLEDDRRACKQLEQQLQTCVNIPLLSITDDTTENWFNTVIELSINPANITDS